MPEEKAVTVRVLGGCKCPNNIKYINIRSEEKLLEFSLTPKSENEREKMEKTVGQFYRLILREERQLYALQKKDGAYISQKSKELKPADVEKHIEGEITVAAKLIEPDTNRAKVAAVDFDGSKDGLEELYNLPRQIQQAAEQLGIDSYIEFSGRRGFHLWIFLDTALPAKTIRRAIKALCLQTGYEPKEIFPCSDTITAEGKGESNGIKLPYALHKASGKQSGFLADEVEWEEGYPIIQPAALMADFKQTESVKLVELASEAETKRTEREQPAIATDFSLLPETEHPACIRNYMVQGSPADEEYNKTNMTLARYAVSRNLKREEATEIARQVAEKTPDHHPTSKSFKDKLDNFKGTRQSAAASPQDYQWHCSYVMASQEMLAREGCIKSACPFFPYRQNGRIQASAADYAAEEDLLRFALANPDQAAEQIRLAHMPLAGFQKVVVADDKQIPVHGILWQAMDVLALEDRQIRQSLILDEVEGGEHKDQLAEVGKLIGQLEAKACCNLETFNQLLARVSQTGARIEAQERLVKETSALADRAIPLANTLNMVEGTAMDYLRKSSAEIRPVRDYMLAYVQDLYQEAPDSIPTPSAWLTNTLNGGWKPGWFYVLSAPPGSGKTTFASWVGDYAAAQGIPVLVVSYEMSRKQLLDYSIARLGGINSRMIEGRKWLDETYPRHQQLVVEISETIGKYQTDYAPNMTILEAGPEDTAATLKGVIASIRTNAGLARDAPVLVIVDYLQLMLTGLEKLDTGGNETVRVSRIATDLKRLARSTKAAVIAISDITKSAYEEAVRKGVLDMSALRDSFKIAHAADGILLLQTGPVGQGEDRMDQLELLEDMAAPDSGQFSKVSQIRDRYPLDEAPAAEYARLNVAKLRGSDRRGYPLFVYEKAYHRFLPIDVEMEEINIDAEA